MLDKSKIVAALQGASKDLFVGFVQEVDIVSTVWAKIAGDDTFLSKVHARKQPILVPMWKGLLGGVFDIIVQSSSYSVLSVDGSQIYYDKHQGPPCFVINIGFIQLRYGLSGKAVEYGSYPYLTTQLGVENDYGSPDFVNMQRESHEFTTAFKQMKQLQVEIGSHDSVCLFDGSLIFFHLDTKDMELKEKFLDEYCQILQKFHDEKMLVVGYMSLPRTKELVNLCKLELAQFDAVSLEQTSVIDRLTDVDIADLYLKKGQRSIIFKSLAPISYLYPENLKPYFCYVHVGSEIVRLEFPAWIALSDELVNKVCSIAFDQAQKGHGYPVCLFEAHEQAVIKSIDRDFFYRMIEKLSQKQAKSYVISQKSIKKQQPIL